MMPLWHWKGGQNPSFETYRVTPADFTKKVEAYVQQGKVGEDKGFPVVAAKPGEDVYLLARMWQWYPVLRLQKGETYRLHLSSLDLVHGFSLFPVNVNFQVVPGYDYGLRVTPTAAGDFRIICNEFCGIGHHTMVGRVILTDSAGREIARSEEAR